jgi:hypothetical protein
MHSKYCGNSSLPEHRDCVMGNWCADLHHWTGIAVAPPPVATPAPEHMVERLTPAQISGIVVGSLALTLLVFFSGFIIGWFRNKVSFFKSLFAYVFG